MSITENNATIETTTEISPELAARHEKRQKYIVTVKQMESEKLVEKLVNQSMLMGTLNVWDDQREIADDMVQILRREVLTRLG